MTNFHATVRHHSIARARVVDLGTSDLAEAKRRATAEFQGDFVDYVLCVLGEPSLYNRDGIVSSRRLGARKWVDAQ